MDGLALSNAGNGSLSKGTPILAIHNGFDPSYLGILAIVALFAGLFFRIVAQQVPRVIPMPPFTVLALAFGLLLGEWMRWTSDEGLKALGDSILNWRSLQASTVLIIFLPALIFESASKIDFHVFRKAFVQVLVLAILGVLINVFLVSVFAKYIFPHDWTFSQSMVFGAMFSATDPVSVVALLRELGAPLSLSMLIEGESLLNDGVAFVIFLYMTKVIKGQEGNVVEFIGDFCYASGIGTLLGTFFGWITTCIAGAIFDDYIAQIILTIIGTFGTFFIVEGVLEASGVLSVVAFGLVYAGFRHGGIDSNANLALENIWEALAFGANAVVFVYSGFLIVYWIHLESSRFPNTPEIKPETWGFLILFYVLLNVIRTLSIACLYPLLSKTGYGINPKWALIISWGGLRGAVGLILGLILLTDPDIDRKFSTLTMFYSIVAATLLINAVTMGPLVRYLGINRQSRAAKTFYYRAVKLIRDHTKDLLVALQRSTRYRGTDWKWVYQHIPILHQHMKSKVESQTGSKIETMKKKKKKNDDEGDEGQKDEDSDEESVVSEDEKHSASFIELDGLYELVESDTASTSILHDARIRYLNLVKSSYYRDFQNGAVTSKSYIVLLLDSATAAQEVAQDELSDWQELSRHCQLPAWYQSSFVKWSKILQHFLVTHHLAVSYQIATAFIHAHESVFPTFKSFVSNEVIIRRIERESQAQVNLAITLVSELEQNFPEITRTIKTRQVTECVLNGLLSYSEELLDNGEIEEKELRSLTQGIHHSRGLLWLSRFRLSKPLDRKRIFRNCELFIGMTKDTVNEILDHATEQVFQQGHDLGLEGGLYILIRGTVKVQCGPSRRFRLAFGDSVNALACVTSTDLVLEPTLKYTITSTDARVFAFPKDKIHQLLLEFRDSEFERNLYFRAGVEAALILEVGPGLTKNPWNAGTIMNKAQVIRPGVPSVKSPVVGGVGILFQGKILSTNGQACVCAAICSFSLNDALTFSPDAVYLWIPPDISWMLGTAHTMTNEMQVKVADQMRHSKCHLPSIETAVMKLRHGSRPSSPAST